MRDTFADDVRVLAELTRSYGVELNVEGNPFSPARGSYPGFLPLCKEVAPAQATLVPDGDAQLTSDHGFDFDADEQRLCAPVSALKALGCRVSVLADAGGAMQAAARCGADRIELYTGPFALAFAAGDAATALAECSATAREAQAVGVGVNAGHDLSQANLRVFLDGVAAVREVSIGHALIGEALYAGLAATVRRYLAILAGG